MKDNSILIMGAIGMGAFLLYKPIQQTGAGVATAAQGLGAGVSTASRGAGESFSEVATGISAPFDYLDQYIDVREQMLSDKYTAQKQLMEMQYAAQAAASLEEAKAKFYIEEGDAQQRRQKEDAKTEREGAAQQERFQKQEIESQGEIARKEESQRFLTRWQDVALIMPEEVAAVGLWGASKIGSWWEKRFSKKNKVSALGAISAPYQAQSTQIVTQAIFQHQAETAKKQVTKAPIQTQKAGKIIQKATRSKSYGSSATPTVGLRAGAHIQSGQKITVSRTKYLPGHRLYVAP